MVLLVISARADAAPAGTNPPAKSPEICVSPLGLKPQPASTRRMVERLAGLGRDADPLVGDLRLQSTFVSRKHAEIRIEGDDLYLVDLGSSSGTRLNGERLAPDEKRKIEIGNEINFADVKVKLLGPD